MDHIVECDYGYFDYELNHIILIEVLRLHEVKFNRNIVKIQL